jgi:hypothetical protein
METAMADNVRSEGQRGWSAREIAQRHQGESGGPLSPVMQAAVTACELAHSRSALKARK